ncbi:hypothetical protein ACX0G9_25365 [Flavitalea flava]
MQNNKVLRPGLFFALIIAGFAGYAQVSWSFSAVKKTDSLVELHLKASLSDGWHLYGTDTLSSPFPTKINILPEPGLKFSGPLQEKGRLVSTDGSVRYFMGMAEFIQGVRVDTGRHGMQGTVQYVICTQEQCLAPVKKDWIVRW